MNSNTSFTRFTRTLCGMTLAIGLLAASTASAVVGYVNVPLPGGYSLVANPLDDTRFALGNTITNLFSSSIGLSGGAGGTVLKWTDSGYSTFLFDGADWTDGVGNPVAPLTLAVGEGAVVYNSGSLLTNTFVGEVRGFAPGGSPEPVLTPPPGIYLRGRIIPAAPGTFENIMGRAPLDGDAVLKLDTTGNPLLSYFAFGAWVDPLGGSTAPTLNVGQSAFFDTTGNQFAGFALPSTVVPEPAAFTIAGLGLMLAGFARRRTHWRNWQQ